MFNVNDRRKDPRILCDDNFQVKVLFSSDDPKMLGKTYDCSTIDVSKSGLQLTSNEAVIVNSVLDLAVSVKGNDKEFLLTGDVKWCRKGTEVTAFKVGISLKPRAGTPTDLDDWKKLIKKLK